MTMTIAEIKAKDLNPEEFIEQKAQEIASAVGDGIAINALSYGVDSSTVSILAHKALGKRARHIFVDNGLMREGEPKWGASLFEKLGIDVKIIPAQKIFFTALTGITDPEQKREVITQTFYRDVFGRIVRDRGIKSLLQGTILTDVDETQAGIKRQHNVFAQIGIDPQKVFGYQIIEPLVQLRKDGVRKVAKALGLPESIYNRMPFLGPALAGRIIGEVTPERVEIVRKATSIMEEMLVPLRPFQCMAILHEDRVTGMRNGKRDFGLQIEVRCWDSVDARTATPTRIMPITLYELAGRIAKEIAGVVSVTYNITSKPPSCMEAV